MQSTATTHLPRLTHGAENQYPRLAECALPWPPPLSPPATALPAQKAVVDAKNHLVTVPLTSSASIPHRIDGRAGAAHVMLRPAANGTGVIAGGAVRVVLELAGVKNIFGKQLGSPNPLNNARATVDGLVNLRTLKQVADERGVAVSDLMK